MFCTPQKQIKARKPHRCTWCGEDILKGETYAGWKNVYETWFSNKMHQECLAASRYDDDEYSAYEHERGTP